MLLILKIRKIVSMSILQYELSLTRISFNRPEEYFNVIGDAISLEGGTEVVINVIPEEIVTDEEVGPQVSIDKRNCRMKDEVPQNMRPLFRSYSRSACLFNCMYQYA